MEARMGQQVVFGAATIVNPSNSSATIKAARLVGDVVPATADVTAIRVVDLGKAPGTGDLLGASRWPARGWSQWWEKAAPVEGAELAAGNAAELIFVVDVNKTGDWLWPQTAIDYEVNGQPYTAVTDFGFQVCPPAPAECRQLHAVDN